MEENQQKNKNSELSDRQENNSDFLQLATLVSTSFDEQINLADTKAQLIIAADTLLAASTAFFLKKDVYLTFFEQGTSLLNRFAAIVSFLLFISLVISLFFALLTARPILILPEQRRSLFYFGHIAGLSEKRFTSEFLSQTSTEIKESMLAQAYAKAVIATRKFGRVRRSMDFLILALFLWAVFQLVVVILP